MDGQQDNIAICRRIYLENGNEAFYEQFFTDGVSLSAIMMAMGILLTWLALIPAMDSAYAQCSSTVC